MTTTPPRVPSRLSVALTPKDVDASERQLVEQLQAALAPSFVLVRRLGAGGMGIVFLARDPALKRLVAVKVMSPERAADPEARARFEREAESVAAISHPNVVAVYSVGELKNGLPYLVMQYVDGPSMAERLKDEGPLDLESAKAIIGQVASALGAAHRKGIIHRDIKTANILWDDVAGRALVSDFGIAAILEREIDGEPINLTQTGMIMGTPQYMSPEQLLSEPVTEKTDIYSLGLLGYELLTGEGPYRISSPNEIMAAHLRDAPRPLSTVRPDAEPELESLLAACLEKDAHGRPTAEDVARRLQRGASVLLEWPPPGLEALHGALKRPLTVLLGGSLAIAGPLVVATTASRGSILRLGFPQVLVLPSIAAIGVLAIAIAGVESMRLLREAIRAARAGYGWTTIAEVLVDSAHDTGALISGEREYAALSESQRSRLRRWRVLGAELRAGAAVWAIVAFFVGLPVATRWLGSPRMLALWTLGVPLTLLVIAGVLGWREWRMVRAIRVRIRAHRAPLDRLSQLAATWRDSFDRLMSGTGLGHGVTGRLKRRAVAVVGVSLVAAAGAVLAYGLVMFSVMGEITQSINFPKFSNIRAKRAAVERLRPLRPMVDPTVTPLRAGYAMQSIGNAGPRAPNRLTLPTKYPIGAIESINYLEKGPFTGGWLKGGAIRQAKIGLSADQRRFLERMASQPGAAEWSILAHAATVDYVGAALVHPFPTDVLSAEIPIPRFGLLKQEGYDQIARAALAVADGRIAEAERLLRENIGVGFALFEGPTLIENLIGVVIAGSARNELVPLYEMTGRTVEARAISPDAAQDDAAPDADLARMTPDARDAFVQAIIRDPAQMRGLRWEFAHGFLAYQPCRDLRQMLFGPDSVHLARMQEARKALVRNSGDDELMRVAERALDTPLNLESSGLSNSLAVKSIMGVARAVDALSGSRRLTSCTIVSPFSGWW